MRYSPAGTRAHHHGGNRGVSEDSPRFKFKDLNASLKAGEYNNFRPLKRLLSVRLN